MITAESLTLVGKINKTHGIGGEMSVSFYEEYVKEAFTSGTCLIMDMDGIFTPFFVGTVRPRSSEALLLTIDNVNSQEEAASYVGKQVYMLTSDLPGREEDEDEGMYAGQLIGYAAYDEGGSLIGEIIDIDDSTENVLFIVRTSEGKTVYIPIVDEFIQEISTDDRRIIFTLPTGLI